MPIENQPKVRILQQWFSEQILPWNLAKQFIGQEKSVLDLIAIGGGRETRKEIINNARVTNAWLGSFLSSIYFHEWPLPNEKKLKDKEVWKIHDVLGKEYVSIATNDKFKDVELEIKDKPPVDSLQKVLLDMLTYTYNYNRNFDGFAPSALTTKIAELRAKFEGQKPDDVITNLFKQWKLDYPNYLNLQQVKIFKQIVIMLSNNIYSNMSINKGLNDGNKILLPYYFELKSNPIHPNKDEIWQFKDAKVILKSEYFDFTDVNNIKLKKAFLSIYAIKFKIVHKGRKAKFYLLKYPSG
ncbi:hypothetical protein [Spiroplasma ixodetis]|uniref:hypothetical protein n=1 Tax=Spiroplasma ixodetis TaxID=2141 RepID=UPI002576ED84|nr:hypothetical protein [Spiroplasma ixodetis]WJG71121.1 hypothetical protein SIXOD_v1c24660 [Spiroplasma ixodetis Y32]